MGRILNRPAESDSDSSSEEEEQTTAKRLRSSSKPSTSNQTQHRLSAELDEDDKKKLVADGIFYILSQEKKRPVFKRPDILKTIGLQNKTTPAEVRDEIWQWILRELNKKFGLEFKSVEDSVKGGFVLANKLPEDPDRDVNNTPLYNCSNKEHAHQGLLFSVLSLIYMSHGKCVKTDVMNRFLTTIGVWEEDFTLNHPTTKETKISSEVRHLFGNVKDLIEKEWTKQHYITVTKNDDNVVDEEPVLEYRWGERAKIEIAESDILKFVAETLESSPKSFRQQFEEIKRQNPDAFKYLEDDEDEEENGSPELIRDRPSTSRS